VAEDAALPRLRLGEEGVEGADEGVAVALGGAVEVLEAAEQPAVAWRASRA
jgi:hypothetical protein